MNSIRPLALAATLALAGVVGQDVAVAHNHQDHGQQADRPSIFELAVTNESPSLKTLAALAAAADLDDDLSAGNFTVFAPTDDAFADLGPDAFAGLLDPDNRDALADVLKYHVVVGSIVSEAISEQPVRVETLAGDELVVRRDGRDVLVNGVKVIAADVRASNGIVHVIDGVLSPDGATATQSLAGLLAADGNLSALRAAVEFVGFGESFETGGPYTVLAPNDVAFGQLDNAARSALFDRQNLEESRRLIRQHVIAGAATARDAIAAGEVEARNGGTLRFEIEDGQLFVAGPVNRVKVLRTDIIAENGVVHVIDGVLLPGDED